MSLRSKGEFVGYGMGCLITAFGIFGNSLVVAAVKKKRSLRSTTNYLLVNLAITDVITLVFLHFGVLQPLVKLQKGLFSDILCKIFISFNIPSTAIASSVVTITVVAVERYHAIVKPMRTGIRLRQETVKYAISSIWLVALVITLPMYIETYYDSHFKTCRLSMKNYELHYKCTSIIILVIIPLVTITFCYLGILHDLYFKNAVSPNNITAAEELQNKRKMINVAFYVTLTFLVCHAPALIVACIRASGYSALKSDSKAVLVSWGVLYVEPLINPFIYAFQSTNFRTTFKEMLRIRHETT